MGYTYWVGGVALNTRLYSQVNYSNIQQQLTRVMKVLNQPNKSSTKIQPSISNTQIKTYKPITNAKQTQLLSTSSSTPQQKQQVYGNNEKVQQKEHIVGRYLRFPFLRLGVLSLLLFVLFVNMYHVGCYVSLSGKIKKKEKVEEGALLGHLEFLTGFTMPILGQFFVEQYIFELGKNKKYLKLIQQAQLALSKPQHRQKFSIHYHKAMALCFLQRFSECKQAIQESYRYASRDKLPYVHSVYQILLSNDWVRPVDIPSGIQFEGSGSGSSSGSGSGSRVEGRNEGRGQQQVSLESL